MIFFFVLFMDREKTINNWGGVMSQQTDQLISIFEQFRKPGKPSEDLFEAVGREAMKRKIECFVCDGKPVEFVLSAFPAKSPNHTEKTLGPLPDGAEEVALGNFVRFANLCTDAYEPGVVVRVVTDGLVFRDILHLSEQAVTQYHERCVRMAAGTPIKIMTLLDFFHDDLTIETALKSMLDQFGQSEEEINDRIRLEPDTNMLYCGLSRFMQTDIVWPEGLSMSQIRKRAGRVGKQMLMRSEAFSRLITHHYPDAVRLSCHPSTKAGIKYSWQFIPGNIGWNTPWHNVLCVVNGRYTLMRRVDAEEQGFELVYKGDQPYYFRDHPSPETDLV